MFELFKTNLKKVSLSVSLWIPLIFIVFFISFAPSALSSAAQNPMDPTAEAITSIQVSGAIIITGVLLTVVTVFGETYVKVKNSLIFTNMELGTKPKYQFYLATILPVVIYTTGILLLSMCLLAAFDAFGLLGSTKNIIEWANIQWGYFVLSITTTITLGISISLFIASFVKDTTYTSLTWAYLFLVFFFGGSSVPLFLIRGTNSIAALKYISFGIPNVYSNFLFINAMSGTVEASNIEGLLDIIMPIALTTAFIGGRYLIRLIK